MEVLSLIHWLKAVSRCQNTLCFSAKARTLFYFPYLGWVLQLSPCACSAGERVGGKAAFSLTCGFLGQSCSWRVIYPCPHSCAVNKQSLFFEVCVHKSSILWITSSAHRLAVDARGSIYLGKTSYLHIWDTSVSPICSCCLSGGSPALLDRACVPCCDPDEAMGSWGSWGWCGFGTAATWGRFGTKLFATEKQILSALAQDSG